MKGVKIFLLFLSAFFLFCIFLAVPDLYQHFYLKDFGLILLRGIGFVLPLPQGDENWFLGFFLVFIIMYIEALIIVSIIYLLSKSICQTVCYARQKHIKPKE